MLASLILRNSQQAAVAQIAFIIAGIQACLVWLWWLWWTKHECRVCGKTPKQSCEHRSGSLQPDLSQCNECGWSYGKHRPDCSFFPDDFNMMG